ncbi:MAG TPA: hypothetical protein VJY34_20375 [Roseiarcus sp.]|nr:hypothetical protein [Roseiarcus sp.]
MLKTLALVGLGASVVVMPLAAPAQTAPPAAPANHHATAHKPTGSYRSHMRHTRNTSKERARASAEHMRTMRQQ